MNLDLRLSVLRQMYAIYDDFVSGRGAACAKGCAHCCTGNVILTTLEGHDFIGRMTAAQRAALRRALNDGTGEPRFQPRTTINRMAALCAAGEEIPEEVVPRRSGACPVLRDDACPFYPARPFACRCMISRTRCAPDGEAQMPPLVVSVNNVVQQYVEHIDMKGFTGNFADVMGFLLDEAPPGGGPAAVRPDPDGLVANHPLTVLMIPPEHREAIRPILDRFRNIRPQRGREDAPEG